jgi:hypothetical protein
MAALASFPGCGVRDTTVTFFVAVKQTVCLRWHVLSFVHSLISIIGSLLLTVQTLLRPCVTLVFPRSVKNCMVADDL